MHGCIVENSACYHEQRHADDRLGKSLELAVAVVIFAVGGLAADVHEHHYDGVREQVRKGMDGVSHHSGTAPEYAGDKLERRQDDVDRTAGQRDLVDFSLPLCGAILDGLLHLLRSLGHSWFCKVKYNNVIFALF